VGRFYEIHRRAPGLEDWWVRHVKVEEAMAAGRISQQWVDMRRKQWGADSALFANRVLGEFHASDEDSLIPLSWVDAAIERWTLWDEAGRPELALQHPQVEGVDVARSGKDSTVFAHRVGYLITGFELHNSEDTMKTAARVSPLIHESDGERPRVVGVIDTIGVGAGVYDRLRELKLPVVPYTGSAKTSFRDQTGEYGFPNCLTEDARVRPIGRLLRIYRSRYQGPLFEVKMASGDSFTATANHQVRSLRGWVPVKSLNTGDKLCDPRGGESPLALAEPQIDHMPPALGEVYGACDRLFGSERMQRGAVDFHGDRPASDVDVVTIDRDLLSVVPSSGQQIKDRDLVLSLLRQSLLTPEGQPHSAGLEGDSPLRIGPVLPDRHVAGGPGSALFGSQALLEDVVGFDQGPQLDPLASEHVGHETLRHADTLGELFDGLPSQVPSRDLVRIGHAATPGVDRFSQRAEFDAIAARIETVIIEAATNTSTIINPVVNFSEALFLIRNL
jgi:hypothetical protein